MIPLTDYEKHYHETQRHCHICNKKSCYDKNDKSKFKNYHKVKDHCHYTGKYRGASHNICNLRYSTQKEIIVVLHNGSAYDFHLIIKELAEQLKREDFISDINCLGKNTEKYISFSLPIKKEKEDGKLVAYKLRFIDSSRFMNTSLAYLVGNLSKVDNISCKKCKGGYNVKSECQYINYSDNRLIYKCNKCNSISHKPIKILVAKCPNTFRFCNKDSNKFMLLLKKGVYHYEYMDSWERFDETSLPNKEYFYSELILEHIN